MNPLTTLACEPIVMLFYTWAGPLPTLTMHLGLVAAMAIVVSMKALFFAPFSGLGKPRAFLMMAVANIVSTIPGVVLGGLMSSGGLALFGIGVTYVLAGILSACTIRSLYGVEEAGWVTPGRVAGWTAVAALLSVAGAAMVTMNPIESTLLYFAFKAAALFLILVPSIVLTILWESLVVMKLTPATADRPRVFRAVVKANLATFLVLFGFGALLALPIRARNPDWMMGGEMPG